MSYKIEHSIDIRASGITPYQPETFQLWVPTPKDVLCQFTINPFCSTELIEVGCKINYWKSLPLSNTVITCFYEHSGIPRIPPTTPKFLIRSLATDEPLTKITENIINSQIINRVREYDVFKQIGEIKIYLKELLKYQYPPQTREAGEVLNIGMSDCGGYHSTFVALARSLGIPAVLDFGFRTENDNYHTWAWWFDKKSHSWIMEDLYDEQINIPKTDRISMTLSTSPKLIPPYPQPVIYLQSHLIWINNIIELEKKGIRFSHSSSWKVTPK